MATVYFCIPEVEELANVFRDMEQHLPKEIEVKYILDLAPESFSEVTQQDLVAIFLHARLKDHDNAGMMLDYLEILESLERRDVVVGIFYTCFSENWLQASLPRQENFVFRLSILQGEFLVKLRHAILSTLGESSPNKRSIA